MIRTEWGPLPDAGLLIENSRSELALAGELNGMGETACSYWDDDKFLLTVQIKKPADFFVPGEIFLLVGKDFSARYARLAKQFVRETANHFCGLRTCVNIDFRTGCRFAEFLGFRSRGEPFEHLGHRFQLYEVY